MKAILSALFLCSFLHSSPEDQVRITLLATNDIHGGIEPSINQGKKIGGLSLLASTLMAIREGLKGQGGVLLLDAGDQFQGTLLSNYSEGQLVTEIFNEMKYDAVVPGNHDYDFGPKGWLVDQSKDESKKRESLESLVKIAKFPFLSANTFLVDSLITAEGEKVKVSSHDCQVQGGNSIDWSKAKRPAFLKPYLIKNFQGVRVAVIALDYPGTAATTTAANVKDLCFGNEEEHYRRLRAQLNGKADLFVLLLHDGDAKGQTGLADFIKRLTEMERLVDAVVSGHTHQVYEQKVNGVPIIQSGANGRGFGQIDLYWNPKSHALDVEKTTMMAGITVIEGACDPKTLGKSCTVEKEGIFYEGVRVKPLAKVDAKIQKGAEQVAPLASLKMGTVQKELWVDRVKESPLANAFTDLLREVTHTDAAFLNTGGLRAPIAKGEFNYSQLYRVFPFNNRTVVIGPMKLEVLKKILMYSVQTCGKKGAIMQSGLKVEYSRNCALDHAKDGMDLDAKLLSVKLLDGTPLIQDGELDVRAPKELAKVATLDFLYQGGDGLSFLADVPGLDVETSEDRITREQFKTALEKTPANWTGDTDGRFKNTLDP